MTRSVQGTMDSIEAWTVAATGAWTGLLRGPDTPILEDQGLGRAEIEMVTLVTLASGNSDELRSTETRRGMGGMVEGASQRKQTVPMARQATTVLGLAVARRRPTEMGGTAMETGMRRKAGTGVLTMTTGGIIWRSGQREGQGQARGTAVGSESGQKEGT